jgi:hypothetical protein
MLNRITIAILLSLLFTAGHSQCTSTDAFIEKEFVIVLSTPKYEAALTMAKSASAKLQYKLDLRGLKKDSASGLTWSKKECEDEWDAYPCYLARGRYDDGNYVSIEYSDAFSGFREGYYIVIVSSWCKGGTQTKTSLAKAKQFYKDAYAKLTKVYLGCMH